MTDPITERIRKKYADMEQDGLFDFASKHHSEERQKAKPVKIVERRKCPDCGKDKVAVVRVLDDGFRPHHVFKNHDRVMRSGHRFTCAGSGKEVPE